ncbi:HTTM domain-containing protein [Flavobacterium sp. J27]|uniref:HTTM domain-containing protein n=1 Tax=Flavobacterium sp. J27 TaxID=2060419 RepID=UPI00103039FC|nr:HTTM domain-containing protein [Flavobacterium sp. J27]
MIQAYLNKKSETVTLAFFRLAFGLMMLFSLIRFASYGWIDKFYIQPRFHFTYYGFEWVKPWGTYTYILFFICGLAALFVAIGYRYKIAIIIFFLSFTYIELMDKTTYLNHYYFISVVSFILIFLPANANYSFDAFLNKNVKKLQIPSWNIDILKLTLAIVYFYAGLAKLNSDWLLEAMPLKIWLPNQSNTPIIGNLFHHEWVQYAFSWFGALYDLIIPFLLWNKKMRNIAFVFVVVFHVLTKILFPIGVFPYVMIISTLIFFSAGFHKRIMNHIFAAFKSKVGVFEVEERNNRNEKQSLNHLKMYFLALFMVFQLLFPFRYLLYPDELFWTEEGFRFSWRVMLMEKAGYAQFYVTDATTKQKKVIDNSRFLTPFQEKQMAFQPDFILEYAHFLHNYYQKTGVNNPIVTVDSYVALNGRLSKRYIDPNIDLAKQYESFQHKTWILPFEDTIKGF